MESIELITKLKEYKGKINKSDNRELCQSTNIDYLDGYLGVVINKLVDIDKYEVYFFIENKEVIASSLLLKIFDDFESADKYFEELKSLSLLSPEDIIEKFK